MTRKQLNWISDEDPKMVEAIYAAHDTFDEFRRHIELEKFRIVPIFSACLVKACIHNEAGIGEHMFLDNPVVDNQQITGELVSQPQVLTEFQVGQKISVKHEFLVDWILLSNDKGIGGFTIDVLKSQVPKEFLKEYCAHPPVSWFDYRKIEGVAELASISGCGRCGHKEYIGTANQEGICGICTNEGSRIQCPSCEAPLIRYPNAPMECHTCLMQKYKELKQQR